MVASERIQWNNGGNVNDYRGQDRKYGGGQSISSFSSRATEQQIKAFVINSNDHLEKVFPPLPLLQSAVVVCNQHISLRMCNFCPQGHDRSVLTAFSCL